MRTNQLLLMLALLMLPLSGCLGFGDDEGSDDENGDGHDDGCDDLTGAAHDACHGGGGNETMSPGNGQNGDPDGNDTVVPNVLPNGTLTMTSGGVVLDDFTAILPGDNITFSAEGSSDPDGTIELIGLIIKDTNSTRTVQLVEGGAFVEKTLQFDHVGPVNITMNVLDDRGEGIQLKKMAYVNAVFEGSAEASAFDPSNSGGCEPVTAVDDGVPILINQQFYQKDTFNVNAGARWFTVTETSGIQAVAICSPTDEELDSGDTSAQTEEGDYETSTAYYAALHPSEPGAAMEWTITVHYEKKPAE